MASRGKRESAPLDAMTSAPDHHRVLLDNDRVRVLETHLAPGDATPVHDIAGRRCCTC